MVWPSQLEELIFGHAFDQPLEAPVQLPHSWLGGALDSPPPPLHGVRGSLGSEGLGGWGRRGVFWNWRQMKRRGRVSELVVIDGEWE